MTAPTTTPKKAATVKSASIADPLAAMKLRAAIENAPAWRPEANDILVGVPIKIVKGETAEFDDYPVFVFREPTPDAFLNQLGIPSPYVKFHCFHGVAQDRMRELKPGIIKAISDGTCVAVQYLGTRVANKPKVGAGGKEEENIYHAYYIELGDGTATAVDDVKADTAAFGF